MINKSINALSQNKWVNTILLLAYYAAVVLPHKRFGAFLNDRIFVGITRDEYNHFVLLSAIMVLLIFCGLLFRNIYYKAQKRWLIGYLIVNILFASIILTFLFVINIEVVHYPQYALFAILSFPLIKNYHQTLIWTTIAGSIDEAYQYFYLAPQDTTYYDMNDVITNLVGAVFGLLFLWSCNVKEDNQTTFVKSGAFYGLVGLGAIILIACLGGVLSIYPSETSSYQLLKEWPPGFWSIVYPDVSFHVTQPLEGLLIVVALWIFYIKIGKN